MTSHNHPKNILLRTLQDLDAERAKAARLEEEIFALKATLADHVQQLHGEACWRSLALHIGTSPRHAARVREIAAKTRRMRWRGGVSVAAPYLNTADRIAGALEHVADLIESGGWRWSL